jgi:molybdate transport system regulatory protein
VDGVNKSSKKPVSKSSIGGKGGGGAKLTSYGKILIEAFVVINKNCWIHLDKQIHKINDI